MLQNLKDNFMKKSLKERFLLFIGVLFFLIYLTFGLTIIFWEKLPLRLPFGYRIALGIVMILYAIIRFLRFFGNNNEE
ncbi:MAG: hypothetical protein JNJ52_07920 [Flavobacterium sp.]|nr:hypothetical protein [Flavobacterium sp.]